MRILVICGTHRRHWYFLGAVQKHIEPAAAILVGREDPIPPPPSDLSPHLQELWRLHFERREQAERRFFGDIGEPELSCPTWRVPAGELNSARVLNWYVMQDPFDLALIAGTEIIREPLFSLLPEYRVNLHMGLIPYFKGTITSFWPQYFLRPHWMGCTYHVIDKLVDTGEILHQTVPPLVRTDGLHDEACRSYVTACGDVGKVLEHVRGRLERGISPTLDPSLSRKGWLFKNSDWHAGLLPLIYETWEDRIVGAYLSKEVPNMPPPMLLRVTPST